MKKITKLLILVPAICLAVMLGGCRTQPIYNVQNQSVATVMPNKASVSSTKVAHAITTAAAGLGWKVTNVRPGLINASIALRGHTAMVSIPYTSRSYSILYKSSTNLDYNGNQIHRNYNGWIKNLNAQIQMNLAHGV